MRGNILKSLLAVIFLTIFGAQVYAQESPNREIGIRLSGLENFDFAYKKENRENRYFRHRLGLVNIGVTGNSTISIWSMGLGYALGIENRKAINDKLKFIHGFEPRVSVSYVFTNDRTESWNFQLGLGYVLGFQYDVSESFYVNIETIPALTFRRNTRDDNNSLYSVNAGFSSNGIAVTLAYRF